MKKTIASFIISTILTCLFLNSAWTIILFMIGLAIHEYGHFAMCRKLSVRSNYPVFYPFIGAIMGVSTEDQRDVRTCALIGVAGPVAGTLYAALLLILYGSYPYEPILFAAMITAMLNLFNLAPIFPMDGGRILVGFGPKLKWVGILCACFLIGWLKQPIMLFIIYIAFTTNIPHLEKNRGDGYIWPMIWATVVLALLVLAGHVIDLILLQYGTIPKSLP